ncbi:VOC family protein [Ureibacillus manganicus]|uniref:Glyoxalase n=1 Tax=Ureibacillus manganicus DSM 26584 TaxID=1384049 RepID=A0A0A3IFM2_9BACL|nr:VOC family protein [Ureibacillus manganicus]KGR73657.1 glyoxalase [Ureibacillus manganicus DSM 26584]
MNLKLRYVILYVSNHEKSKHFYNEILGLPIRGEHGTYIEFETGSTILSINTRESVKEITGLNIAESKTSQTFELGFVVEDVKETIENLRKQDVQILVEPIEKPWGQVVAYVADPDGHYIEICSSLD